MPLFIGLRNFRHAADEKSQAMRNQRDGQREFARSIWAKTLPGAASGV